MLFGADGLYIVFKLYYLVYSRLQFAFCLAQEQVSDQHRRDELNRMGENGLRSSKDLVIDAAAAHLKVPFRPSNSFSSKTKTAEGLFEDFMMNARARVRGELREDKYTAKCTEILGPQSYPLFTLRKCVERLSTEVRLIFEEHSVAFSLIEEYYHFNEYRDEGPFREDKSLLSKYKKSFLISWTSFHGKN